MMRCPFYWSLRSPVSSSIINFSRRHQMSKRQFEDDSSCVSKGSPSADQPSKAIHQNGDSGTAFLE